MKRLVRGVDEIRNSDHLEKAKEKAKRKKEEANRAAGFGGAVAYDRLEISADRGVHCGEEVKYLLDESKEAKNQFGTSKANFQTGGQVTIEIKVKD